MSEDHSLTTAVYRLGENEKRLSRVETKLDDFITSVNGKFEDLMGMLSKFPACPKPGLCVVLEEKVKLDEREKLELRNRLSNVEQKVFYNEGFGRGIMWVVAVGGSLVGSFIMFILTRVFTS